MTNISAKLARGLFLVGRENNALKAITADLATMNHIVAAKEFQPALSPLITQKTLHNILDCVAKQYKMHNYSLGFFKLCCKRLYLMTKIHEQFHKLCDEYNNIVRARVTSASAINDKQKKQILTTIADTCCDKKVEVSYKIDDCVIEGFIVEFESYMIDSSLNSRLKQMQQNMLKVSESFMVA